MNSRRCDICNNDVHRVSHAKHLRIKKHLKKENKMK